MDAAADRRLGSVEVADGRVADAFVDRKVDAFVDRKVDALADGNVDVSADRRVDGATCPVKRVVASVERGRCGSAGRGRKPGLWKGSL